MKTAWYITRNIIALPFGLLAAIGCGVVQVLLPEFKVKLTFHADEDEKMDKEIPHG